jgi:hypothetical protein
MLNALRKFHSALTGALSFLLNKNKMSHLPHDAGYPRKLSDDPIIGFTRTTSSAVKVRVKRSQLVSPDDGKLREDWMQSLAFTQIIADVLEHKNLDDDQVARTLELYNGRCSGSKRRKVLQLSAPPDKGPGQGFLQRGDFADCVESIPSEHFLSVQLRFDPTVESTIKRFQAANSALRQRKRAAAKAAASAEADRNSRRHAASHAATAPANNHGSTESVVCHVQSVFGRNIERLLIASFGPSSSAYSPRPTQFNGHYTQQETDGRQ